MWIEKEIQKDADSIQKTIEHLSRDYKAQLPRTIVSRIHVRDKEHIEIIQTKMG
jgi:tRNA(Ser,Leu) C12 N-acetylase TAN1